MPTYQDMHIFVTGTVGRAMGSGKFSSEDVLSLTQAAYDAFCAIFGKPEAPAPYQPPARPTAQPAQRGPQPAAPAFQATASQAIMASFDSWADKPSYIGGKDAEKWTAPSGKLWRDTTWRELMDLAVEGNKETLNKLAWVAKQQPGTDPKWAENDKRKIANAGAVLHMSEQMRKSAMPAAKDETPF